MNEGTENPELTFESLNSFNSAKPNGKHKSISLKAAKRSFLYI